MSKRSPVLETLWNETYDRIASLTWLYEIQKEQKSGARLASFAAGALVAAELADVVEEVTPFRASWGQVLRANGTLSGEVDVIVYSGSPVREWEKARFAIVPEKAVKATIECDTEFHTGEKYKKKLKSVKMPRLPAYIFSLYCYRTAATFSRHRKRWKKLGWSDAFVLYTGTDGETENREDWFSLMDQLLALPE